MGISFGLALVEGLLAAGWATWVPDRSVCAPSVERGGGGSGWAAGLTGGALRAGLELPTKTSGEICCLEQCRPDAERFGPFCSGVRSGRRRGSPWGLAGGLLRAGYRLRPGERLRGVRSVARGADGPRTRLETALRAA